MMTIYVYCIVGQTPVLQIPLKQQKNITPHEHFTNTFKTAFILKHTM